MSKDKMTNTPVQHKRSSVSGNIPDNTQLEVGELAINFPDQSLYTKDGNGQVIELGGHDSALVQGQINASRYTYANFNDDFATKTTDDLYEGITNLYYDSALVEGQIDSDYNSKFDQSLTTVDNVEFSSITIQDSSAHFGPVSLMRNDYGADSEIGALQWVDYGNASGTLVMYSKSNNMQFAGGDKSNPTTLVNIEGTDVTFSGNAYATGMIGQYFSNSTTNSGFKMTSTNIQPSKNGNNLADNQVDLGSSGYGFKDGYWKGTLYAGNTRFTEATLAHGSSIHNKITTVVTSTGSSYNNQLKHTDTGLEFNSDRSQRGWRFVNGSTIAMNLSATGNALFSGSVNSQTLRVELDTDLSDSVVSENNALFTDSDGIDFADVKIFLKSLHDRIGNFVGGHDSALVADQIDSALDQTQYISTVNGVGPTPGTNDIGIHGGNTQTDAGSGVYIKADLDSKVKRVRDTNTGTTYDPTNGVVNLPMVTDTTVQSMIDADIADLKFIDSADVATVVDPKLPFGSSAMGIVHASWDASAGTTTPSILSSYGVSGITRIDTGEYRVDFMTNFVNANYTVTTGCGTNDYSGTGASPRTVSVLSRANSSVTVLCERTDDAVNEDNEYMSVMIMGNQVSS